MDGFSLVLLLSASAVVADVALVVGVIFPDASVFVFVFVEDDEEINEIAFPNIPFPDASVTFPDASVFDENNENGSKFEENKSVMFVVPPNNDEIILFFIFKNPLIIL